MSDADEPAEAPRGEEPTAEPDLDALPPTDPSPAPDGLDLAKAAARAWARAQLPTGTGAGAGRRGQRRTPPSSTGAWSPRPAGRGGRGPRLSGAHPDERDPQTLDTTLGRLVRDHGWAVDLQVHGVVGRWRELVGDEVAAHCTPEGYADGRLTVRTDSTAWAVQLRLLAPTIVRRLNEELGHGTVTVIDVLGPHLPTWSKGPRSVRDGRGPRDTYG